MKSLSKKMISIFLIMTLISSLGAGANVSATNDEFDTLREKWVEMLTGGTEYDVNDPLIAAQITVNTDAANEQWSKLNTQENRTYLWSDLQSTTASSQITTAFNRLYAMALAYRTKGSPLEGNQELSADITGALEWMSQNRYNMTVSKYDNWWDWEIGSPKRLNDTLCLMYDELPADLLTRLCNAVNRFKPDPTRANGQTASGANRVWVSIVVAVRGILVKDGAKIAAARDSLTAVFSYVTNKDGFYRDGSFIQHTSFAYTGGYGIGLIIDMSSLLYLLHNSTWEVVAPSKSNVFRWIYDSFEPLVYKGQMMDMVSGREISRINVNPHATGKKLMRALVTLAQVAPQADKEAFGSMVLRWSEENTFSDFYTDTPIFALLKARELVAESETGTGYTGLKVFARMDRVVMQRPGFALGLAMYSKSNSYRTASFENINGENRRGSYTAAGALYLYNDDLSQYADHFWPTVNSYRLPGTTLNRSKGVAAKSSSNDFAGGASLDDMYGVAGMRFVPENSAGYGLDAKKSYFMFDDEVVAVGTVNSSDTVNTTETIMENRKINGDNILTVGGEARAQTSGTTDEISNVKWAHLAGNVSGSDIGYYLPKPATLNALRETRTDSWYSINTNYASSSSGKANRTNRFMTLWFDQGISPVNKPYSYVLLPNKSVSEVEQYANDPDIQILAHTDKAHVASESNLGITAANFWEDESVTAGGITSNKRASVIMRQTGNELSVSVSDPTQTNTGTITLGLDKTALSTISLDSNVTVLSYSPLTVSVNVNGKRGTNSNMKFEVQVLSPFEALGAKLAQANVLYETASANTGTEPGQFDPLAVAALDTEIQTAQGVYDDPEASETDLINAANALQAAMSLCVPVPPPTPTPTPPPTPTPAPIATVIVDNTDSAFTTDAAWSLTTATPGYYGPNYLHDGTPTAADTADRWAKWTPQITVAGTYNIYMWWTTGTNRPAAAPLEIKYGDLTDESQTVNQQQNNAQWVFVGTYDLTAGTDNYVKILATDVGATIADAVKFECIAAAEADKTALGEILTEANALYIQAAANIGTGGDQYSEAVVAALSAAIVSGETVYDDEDATQSAVNAAAAAIAAAIANCVINSEVPTPTPTPEPTPEPTPTPTPVTGERILLNDNFNSYTDLAAMQDAGWVISGAPVLATVAAEENLQYLRTTSAAASSMSITFEPVPLKASAGESPGKNAKLVISFDMYLSGGTGSSQSYYRVFDSAGALNAVAAGRRGSSSLRYSKAIAAGSTDFLIASSFTRFKKVKFVVKFTDGEGAFITPKVDIYYDNMDTPLTDGENRNMIDTATTKVDKFLITSSAGGPSLEVDNLKIVLQTDAASSDKSGLLAAIADATALFAAASENTGAQPGQYDPAVVAALSSAISSAQAVFADNEATQQAVDAEVLLLEAAMAECVPNPATETPEPTANSTVEPTPEPTIEPTPAPDFITSSDEYIVVDSMTKKIFYPHYKIGTVNYHYLATIKSKLAAVSGYTYKVVESDGETLASGTVTEPMHKVIVSYEGTPVATYTFVATIQYGDVNGDGAITASDLGLLKKYLMNKTVNAFIKPYGIQAADINKQGTGSNTVTATDLGLLKRYLMSKTSYPISEPTVFVYDPE